MKEFTLRDCYKNCSANTLLMDSAGIRTGLNQPHDHFRKNLNRVIYIYCSTNVVILPGGNVYTSPLAAAVIPVPASAFLVEEVV